MTGCRSAAKHALHYIQELSRTDVGLTVSDCERLVEEHSLKVKEVLEDSRLQGLRTEGKSILERISFEEFNAYHLTDDYKHTLECVNRLYAQMTKVFDRLQAISDRRTQTLDLCLKVRIFEEKSSKVCKLALVFDFRLYYSFISMFARIFLGSENAFYSEGIEQVFRCRMP